MCKKSLLELRDVWGFTLFQLRHVMELQCVTNVEHDPVYLALQGRLMGLKQAEQLLRGIYLLTGTSYRIADIDIRVEEASE